MTSGIGRRRTGLMGILSLGLLICVASQDASADGKSVEGAVAAIKEAIETKLPLAGSWNTHTATPQWQIETLMGR